MDVWTYFLQRETECQGLSLTPLDGPFAEMCFEVEGSDGQRGRWIGNLYLSAQVYLAVSETVQVVGQHVERDEYAYYLVVEGEEVWGYETDLSHEPSTHAHFGPHHPPGVECPRVSFPDVAQLAWDEFSSRVESGELEYD